MTDQSIDSYQKVQQIYNKEVSDILDTPVVVEEKVDGSHFRIQITKDGIKCGSHHQEMVMPSHIEEQRCG